MKKEQFKYPEAQAGVIDGFYKEIFYDGEYDRYGAKVESGDVVIDCGAFVGMFSHFAMLKGAKQVYSIESNKSHYDCLVENTKHIPQIKTYNGLVGDKRNETNNYNVERVMDENNIQYVDFLKMDIEGSEFPALMNMGDEVMCRVRKWAIEFHVGWTKNQIKWEHGVDFDGHKASKLLYIMDKFTRNGFKLGYEHIHKKYNIVMLYAWK